MLTQRIMQQAQRSHIISTMARSMSYYHNFIHPPFFYVNGVKYINDYDIEEYKPQVQAFLTKRRLTKREVPPRVSIIKDMGPDYRHVYNQQKLVPGEILYNEKHMQRLHEMDEMNSQYVHSVFCQEYEKNMIEAIKQKIVMNGSVPSIMDKPRHDIIVREALSLHRQFYEGEELTILEKDIERTYITDKLYKLKKWRRRKSYRFKVKWTNSDYNCLQEHVNYRMNSLDYFDKTKPVLLDFDLD